MHAQDDVCMIGTSSTARPVDVCASRVILPGVRQSYGLPGKPIICPRGLRRVDGRVHGPALLLLLDNCVAHCIRKPLSDKLIACWTRAAVTAASWRGGRRRSLNLWTPEARQIRRTKTEGARRGLGLSVANIVSVSGALSHASSSRCSVCTRSMRS
jgi:hypothetical protein